MECAVKSDIIDTINVDAVKETNELLQLIKSDLKENYSLDIYENTKNSTLTEEMRLRIKKLSEKYFEEKKLSKAIKWLDKFETIMNYMDTFESFCEEIVSYINIRNMNDSMKETLREMEKECPINNQALKKHWKSVVRK